jgi:hypothetical protein
MIGSPRLPVLVSVAAFLAQPELDVARTVYVYKFYKTGHGNAQLGGHCVGEPGP